MDKEVLRKLVKREMSRPMEEVIEEHVEGHPDAQKDAIDKFIDWNSSVHTAVETIGSAVADAFVKTWNSIKYMPKLIGLLVTITVLIIGAYAALKLIKLCRHKSRARKLRRNKYKKLSLQGPISQKEIQSFEMKQHPLHAKTSNFVVIPADTHIRIEGK